MTILNGSGDLVGFVTGVFLNVFARFSKVLKISILRLVLPKALLTSHHGFLGIVSPEIAAFIPVSRAYSSLVLFRY